MARAHVMMAPERRARQVSGTVTRKNASTRVAPRLRATFSIRGVHLQESVARVVDEERHPTNNMASTMPQYESLSRMWNADFRGAPTMPARPKMKSRAMPAIVCGITTGMSTMPSTTGFPAKSSRASTYPRGIPNNSAINVAIAAALRVRASASRTEGSRAMSRIRAGSVVNSRFRMGRIMNRTSRRR